MLFNQKKNQNVAKKQTYGNIRLAAANSRLEFDFYFLIIGLENYSKLWKLMHIAEIPTK